MRALGSLKAAARYAAGWGTVILFALLLTLIFSFLGAFFCAALAGMMLGSFRVNRWQTIALSFTFPAVLFGVLRSGGSELMMRQVLLLSVLCLGTFWLTYFVVRLVVWYEHKGQTATLVAAASNGENETAGNGNGVPAGELNLQVLQGKWSCVSANHNSSREHKYLEIQREDLLLIIRDSAGKIHFRGRGAVELRDGCAVPRLSITPRIAEADDTLVCI